MLQADTAQQSDVATANKAAAAARKAAKTTAIVNLHLEELMMEAMIEGDAFFVRVEQWLQGLLPLSAAGQRCLVRPASEIKKIIQDSAQTKTVQSGGTLSMLNLSRRAFPRINTAKVLFVLKSWDGMPLSLSGLLGTIQVNADMWSDDVMSDLTRASSDAECQAWIGF